MKKCRYLLLLLVLICTAFGLFACDNGGGETTTEQPIVITLSESEISLEEYETAKLTATVLGTEEAVTWSSANESIATVNGGEVYGVAVGTTTVTAKVADKTASCNVTVLGTTSVATITMSHDKTTLRTGDELNVSAQVKFKGEVQDVPVTFASENAEVATIENGKITAIGVGETKIYATAQFAGRMVQSYTVVTVRDDVEIDVTTTSVVLKNDATIDPDKVSYAINATAKVNNAPYDGEITMTIADDTVASLEAGVIKAKKAGSTTVIVSITHGGKTYSEQIIVLVEKSELKTQIGNVFETYNSVNSDKLVANTLELPLNGQTLSKSTVTLVSEKGEKSVGVTAQEEVIQLSGEEFGSEVYGAVKILAETETHKLAYHVNVVTKYINTAQDFNDLTIYGNIDENCDYDGYFIMTEDVVLPQYSGQTFWNVQRPITEKTDGSTGFKGVFDGNGYQISFKNWGWIHAGVEWGDYREHNGLFGNVAQGAVIKNLGLDASMHQMWEWVFGCVVARCFAGTMENCHISVRATDFYAVYTGIAQYTTNATFIDCVLSLDLHDTKNPWGDSGNGTYENGPNYCTSYISQGYKNVTFENFIVVINERQEYNAETGEWVESKANPFRDKTFEELGIEGVTVYDYAQDFALEDLPFKTQNKKYWRTTKREVLSPLSDGTWGEAKTYAHYTMKGGINEANFEIGVEWPEKW